jgi:DNA modification methylase
VTVPSIATDRLTVYLGDAREVLSELPDESVNCIVTSPPYWNLRDYGVDGQIGLESSPAAYLAALLPVFVELRRVLRKDGTLWVNMGDGWVGGGNGGGGSFAKDGIRTPMAGTDKNRRPAYRMGRGRTPSGLKNKDLVGMPWRLAFALQESGWWLRSDIVWSKPNPMPEAVTDRPTKAHEYVFLLTRSARYWYADRPMKAVVRTPKDTDGRSARLGREVGWREKHGGIIQAPKTQPDRRDGVKNNQSFADATVLSRNSRSVWEIATMPYADAHFATFPEELPRRCILAGCPAGGVVLDPFCGTGTTLSVANALGRQAIGIDLDPDNLPLIRERCDAVALEAWNAGEPLRPRERPAPLDDTLAHAPLFDLERERERDVPKQDQLGKRTYTGFNARWDAAHGR